MSELGVGRSGQKEAGSAPCSSPVDASVPWVAGRTSSVSLRWQAQRRLWEAESHRSPGNRLGGAGARSRGARAARTRGRGRGDPIQGAEVPGSACLRLPPGKLSLRPSRDPYINSGQSPEKHSSLLAAAWRSCGAARAAEAKKRERLGICSSGCCKTLGANLAPASASQPFPSAVPLCAAEPVLDPTSPPSVFRAEIAKTEGERGGRSSSQGCCQPRPPRAGLAPGTSARRSWGITTGCATTG